MAKADKKALPKNLTFEAALARLQAIVDELEDPEKGLEASLELFEEGVALSRFCRAKIDEIQSRVEVVLKETPEGFATKEMESEEGDAGDDEDDEEDEKS
jgi:exodeoxyribonuclease VII small subunit